MPRESCQADRSPAGVPQPASGWAQRAARGGCPLSAEGGAAGRGAGVSRAAEPRVHPRVPDLLQGALPSAAVPMLGDRSTERC